MIHSAYRGCRSVMRKTLKIKSMKIFGSRVWVDVPNATRVLFNVTASIRAQPSAISRATKRSNVGSQRPTKQIIRLLVVAYQSGTPNTSEVIFVHNCRWFTRGWFAIRKNWLQPKCPCNPVCWTNYLGSHWIQQISSAYLGDFTFACWMPSR